MTLQPLTPLQVRNHVQDLFRLVLPSEAHNLLKSSCLALDLKVALDQSLPDELPDTYGKDCYNFYLFHGICWHLCYSVAEDLVSLCSCNLIGATWMARPT